MLMYTLTFVGGLILLLTGGRLLVQSSVDTARRLSVSPLVVGLTLVAWGTSAPELALNLISAAKGRPDLAIGNIVGANICNLALVLGVCAIIKPLVVQQRLIRIEIWLNAAILVSMAALAIAFGFAPWQSALFLAVFGGYSTWTIMAALRKPPAPSAESLKDAPTEDPMHVADPDSKPPWGWLAIGAGFLGGLTLLSTGGWLASNGATGAAISLGVPAAIVGVTIVSIGTTLPELITGVLAVRKGQTDLAMGNAIGSCLFNAGAVFGLVGLISAPTMELSLELPLAYMGALAIALIPISRTFNKTVSRVEGVLLLSAYAAFLAASAYMVIGTS